MRGIRPCLEGAVEGGVDCTSAWLRTSCRAHEHHHEHHHAHAVCLSYTVPTLYIEWVQILELNTAASVGESSVEGGAREAGAVLGWWVLVVNTTSVCDVSKCMVSTREHRILCFGNGSLGVTVRC